MKAFIFSGLGADERVFEHIDFGTFSPVFIPWKALDKNETLDSYALKMSESFPKSEPFLLIGISFGGILAQTVSNYFPQARLLLIASVQQRQELSLPLRIAKTFKIHAFLPIKFLLRFKRGNYWFFGTKTPEERQVLNAILKDTSPLFAKWAIQQILNWKQNKRLEIPIVHIHGSLDRIFPLKNVQPTIVIEKGTHFMTVSQPQKLSNVIQMALNRLAAV